MDIPKFIQLKGGEEVLDVIHASILPRLGKLFLLLLWVVLPFFFLFPLWQQGSWGVVVFFAWLASGVLLMMRAYTMWAKTVLVITDRRIIDCDQQGFFHRVVTEARYHQIDEVSYRIKGFFQTVFRYGVLRMELHGASADLEILDVTRPHRVTDLINDLRSDTYQQQHAQT